MSYSALSSLAECKREKKGGSFLVAKGQNNKIFKCPTVSEGNKILKSSSGLHHLLGIKLATS